MRGLISNEAGCGTSPTAHAESDGATPEAQGIWGIFEVFVDTILLCTVTALVIIVSGVPVSGVSFMEITVGAYSSVLGEWARIPLAAAVFFFGFATVSCWSFYGTEGALYLYDKPISKYVFAAAYTIAVFIGGTAREELLWTVADMAIGIMTVINVFTLYLMRKEIKRAV